MATRCFLPAPGAPLLCTSDIGLQVASVYVSVCTKLKVQSLFWEVRNPEYFLGYFVSLLPSGLKKRSRETYS